jgi:hypothetical protein
LQLKLMETKTSKTFLKQMRRDNGQK